MIKPCPFCGYVGLDFHEGTTFRWLAAECGGCGATCGETRVQTIGQGTKDEWMQQAQADAIEVWNTRVQNTGDQAMQQEIKELHQAIEQAEKQEPAYFICHGHLYPWPSEDNFCGNPEDHILLYTHPPEAALTKLFAAAKDATDALDDSCGDMCWQKEAALGLKAALAELGVL